jgi:hypothetical protein
MRVTLLDRVHIRGAGHVDHRTPWCTLPRRIDPGAGRLVLVAAGVQGESTLLDAQLETEAAPGLARATGRRLPLHALVIAEDRPEEAIESKVRLRLSGNGFFDLRISACLHGERDLS